jgi:small-conductance mechanosensitive channel
MNNILEWLAKFFGHINVSGIEAMSIKGLYALLVLLGAFAVSRMLKRYIDHRMRQNNPDEKSAVRRYKNVACTIVWTAGALLALHAAGLDLSTFFTTGGLLAVALAFAVKNIAENYVAGIMIMFESTFKPGDVLETDGIMIRIESIGRQHTIARTKDERDIMIPNSYLIQNKIANYTLKDSICRVWTMVGVSYSSDLKKVRDVLKDACGNLEGLSYRHAPQILLAGFGDSTVNYKVSVWIEDPWISGQIKSNLNEAVWWALKDAGIEIAFPQLDVHFDENFRP